ncbi:MAG: DUF1579 domain-containing protein [Candidatus Omnitrophota bacterium]
MSQGIRYAVITLFFCGIIFVGQGYAQDQAAPAKTEQELMMEKWQQFSTPNENHKNLDFLAGEWTYTMKWWQSADTTPEESTGTTSSRWILGGRFVQSDVKGESMGQPFEGINIIGYNNLSKEYNSIWIDNMSTAVMATTSQYDPATKTFTEQGSVSCPMTGETNRAVRGISKIMDADHYSYEMFMNGLDGKEYKTMELIYSRVK